MKRFISFFLKQRPNETLQDFNCRAGNFAGVFGLFVNALLFGGKLLAGVFASSISIIADAVNNLTDTFSNIISIASFQISKKPADKEHPFGHARAEYIFSSVVAVIIVVLGLQLFYQSALKIKTPTVPNFSVASIVVLIFSISAKLFLSAFYMVIAKKINSPLLEATSADSRADVLSTSVILFSIPVYYFTGFSVDSYLGVLASILVIKSGIDILKDTVDRMLGTAPTREEVERVHDFIMGYDGIYGVHDIIIHDYGPAHRFVTAHAEVDATANIIQSHEIIDRIESDAVEQLNMQLILHMDPVALDDHQLNEARRKVGEALASIDMPLSFHDFRMVHGYHVTNVVFDVAVPQECKLSDAELLHIIANAISKIEPTFKPIITFDRNYIRSESITASIK